MRTTVSYINRRQKQGDPWTWPKRDKMSRRLGALIRIDAAWRAIGGGARRRIPRWNASARSKLIDFNDSMFHAGGIATKWHES
jgi:hypothetical protein